MDPVTQALQETLPGSEVVLPPGRFQGPWVIDRPITISGAGPDTVLWSRDAPVLTVQAAGVRAQDLVLDAGHHSALALQIVPGSPAPRLSRVLLAGRAEGFPFQRRWALPNVIRLGEVPAGRVRHRFVVVEAPTQFEVVQVIPELVVVPQSMLAAPLGLRARWSGGLLPANARLLSICWNTRGLAHDTYLDGFIAVSASGMIARIRVSGRVVEPVESRLWSRAKRGRRRAAQRSTCIANGLINRATNAVTNLRH